MQSSIVSHVRFLHVVDANDYLFDVEFRCVPDQESVVVLSAELRLMRLNMVDSPCAPTKGNPILTVTVPPKSDLAITAGSWFVDQLASNDGEWERVARDVHRAILKEASGIESMRREEHANRVAESMR